MPSEAQGNPIPLPEGRVILLLCGVGAGFVLAYLPTLRWLLSSSLSFGYDDAHAYLAVAGSGYLLWRDRRTLAGLPAAGERRGLTMLIVALAAHWVALRCHVRVVSAFSVLLALHGLALYLWGRRATRHLLLPIYFLVFALPLLYFLQDYVGFPMRLRSTAIGAAILGGIGVNVVREGTTLIGATFTMDVGIPCSGVKSLTAMTMVAIFFVYLRWRSLMPRLVLVALVPAMALLSNSLRVVMLGVGARLGGTGFITGAYHPASGVFVFVMTFGLLCVCSWCLRWTAKRAQWSWR